MEKNAYLACLLDFYGPLLTPRQQDLLHLRAEEDLSLSEIAQALCVSRQAVSDGLRAAEARLLQLEDKLGLYARHDRMAQQVQRAVRALRQGEQQEALSILISMEREEEYGI